MKTPPTTTLLLTNVKGKVRIKHANRPPTDVATDTELHDADYLTLLETADSPRQGSSCTVTLALKFSASDIVAFKRDHSGLLDLGGAHVFVLQEPCLDLRSVPPLPRPKGHRHDGHMRAHLVSHFPACLSLGQFFTQDTPPHYQILTPGGTVRVHPEVEALK